MRALYGFMCRLVNLARIGAVYDDSRDAVANGALGKVFHAVLHFRRRGVGPEVALDEKHQTEVLHGGEVDAFVGHARGLSTVADVSHDCCVALGARLQGRNVAAMTYIREGGQAAGVTYEGINFAAVQDLGLVLFVESNLWAYSTPSEMQYRVEDLAERAIGYGVPGVIVDGTDACQIYEAAHEAVERAHRGEGPTLIEAKMMRMKGHAIHNPANYVPKRCFHNSPKRHPITRFQNYLVNVKKW